MRRFAVCYFLMLALASFLVTSSCADELDALYSFYNGLADIIEQNRNDPDVCVTKVSEFVKNNAQALIEAAKKAEEAASQRQPTEEEVARMMNEPPPAVGGGRGMNPIERFSLVFGIFAQKYPEQASKITQIVQQYIQEQQEPAQ